MYAYIKGTLEETTEDSVVVEAGGIGYNIKVSTATAELLPGVGNEVKIYTYTLVREDAFALFGFLTRDDLEIFKKLIAVNGIGPKGGLAILSVMSADALRFAVMAGDAKAIAKAPGIGAKTAERVILELRDKISLEDTLKGLGEPTGAGGRQSDEAGGYRGAGSAWVCGLRCNGCGEESGGYGGHHIGDDPETCAETYFLTVQPDRVCRTNHACINLADK